MKTVSKALIGTVAAGAMAASAATPAFAAERHRDRGVDAGDIIAGAVILGGIAAIASSARNNRDRDYRTDVRYRDNRAQRRGNPRSAVERCVRAAERDARRYGYRSADVTQIRDVDRTSYGWRVKGRIVVDGQRGYRGNRGYGVRRNDDRRYDYGYQTRGYDQGRFTCHIERGRGADVNFKGIRGLR